MALAAAYRALNLQNLVQALRGSVAISGMILFIILVAITFSQILSFSGATQGIVTAILGHGLSTLAILAGMMALLIFLGIFVDQVSMMLITLPVYMPIVQRLDIDLIWFGVLYLICMQPGCCCHRWAPADDDEGVAPPQATMAHIFRAVVPYIAMVSCCC
jgi:TRAP-type mannitol/chloroaromatic compound transport system permease large subunit